MEGVKSILLSRTFWGAMVALAGGVASLTGHQIDAATQAELTNQLLTVGGGAATIIGAGYAIYGRYKANTLIKK